MVIIMEVLTFELAQKIKAHLLKTKQGFVFYQGVLVSLDDCNTVIDYCLK